jgi:hypothetical protein
MVKEKNTLLPYRYNEGFGQARKKLLLNYLVPNKISRNLI